MHPGVHQQGGVVALEPPSTPIGCKPCALSGCALGTLSSTQYSFTVTDASTTSLLTLKSCVYFRGLAPMKPGNATTACTEIFKFAPACNTSTETSDPAAQRHLATSRQPHLDTHMKVISMPCPAAAERVETVTKDRHSIANCPVVAVLQADHNFFATNTA